VGCGFIQFAKKNKAAKAILSSSGRPLLGQTIIVDWVVPKSVFTTDESSAKERECNIGELVKSIKIWGRLMFKKHQPSYVVS
jgi:RNA recognition motif-containing protein